MTKTTTKERSSNDQHLPDGSRRPTTKRRQKDRRKTERIPLASPRGSRRARAVGVPCPRRARRAIARPPTRRASQRAARPVCLRFFAVSWFVRLLLLVRLVATRRDEARAAVRSRSESRRGKTGRRRRRRRVIRRDARERQRTDHTTRFLHGAAAAAAFDARQKKYARFNTKTTSIASSRATTVPCDATSRSSSASIRAVLPATPRSAARPPSPTRPPIVPSLETRRKCAKQPTVGAVKSSARSRAASGSDGSDARDAFERVRRTPSFGGSSSSRFFFMDMPLPIFPVMEMIVKNTTIRSSTRRMRMSFVSRATVLIAPSYFPHEGRSSRILSARSASQLKHSGVFVFFD